jgi:hypothetical protein
MKNRIAVSLYIGLALIAGLLVTARSVSAQQRAIATIPFAFEVNDQSFPAGDYKFYVLTPRLISLMDQTNGTYRALFLVDPEQERNKETQGRLIFVRHGMRYYLKQVRFEGFGVHANVKWAPSLERELAKQTPPNTSTVQIAMK